MTKDQTRRDFLRTAGASAFTLGAAAALESCRNRGFSDTKSFHPELNSKLEYDKVVYSACGICMVGCGMKVYVKDDRAIFVEGNPADPFSRGHLCPKGKASLGFLYNPDRLLYPLKRTNTAAKDVGVDPQWQRITWEEAYQLIVSKIQAATNNFANGERLAVFTHGEYGWVTKLLTGIGSPNIVTHYDTCFITSFVGRKALTGGLPWTNLRGADYILSFGWDQPERAKNQPTADFSEAAAGGAKVVCFNPFQGAVGAKADQWIPIKPGTDLAVMLAMINYILSNNLFNSSYVGSKTNFSAHETAIRNAFSSYTTSWAEGISGVPAATIEKIAKEFTSAKKAILPIHKRDGATGPNYANSFHATHAALILNALVGAIDREGGEACLAFGYKPKAHLEFEENPPKDLKTLITEKGSIDGKHKFPLVRDLITDRGIFSNTADRIIKEDPYPLKMAIFRRYGLLTFPNPAKMAQALKKLDYVVFVDTMPKQIMWYADLVLPEPVFLEGDGIAARKYCTPGYKFVLVKTKAHAPLGENKGWSGVVMEIGKRIDQLRGTKYFKLKGGDWVTPGDEKNSIANDLKSGMTFAELLQSPNGIYIKEQATYKSKSSYKTPSGKIEIYSEKMSAAGYDPLPKWIPKASTPDSTYPFYLLLRRWPGIKHSAPVNSDNPYSLDAFPYPVAVIHPSKAASLGIEDDDEVWIESSNGKMKARARISERIRPDCVMTNHNYGHTMLGLTYKFPDQSDGPLVPDRAESTVIANKDWSACAWMCDVCVKVYKA